MVFYIYGVIDYDNVDKTGKTYSFRTKFFFLIPALQKAKERIIHMKRATIKIISLFLTLTAVLFFLPVTVIAQSSDDITAGFNTDESCDNTETSYEQIRAAEDIEVDSEEHQNDDPVSETYDEGDTLTDSAAIDPVPLCATTGTSSNLSYATYDGKAVITKCNTSATGSISIPSTLDGYPVEEIASYAFDGCTDITDISIPYSVKKIGTNAFHYCNSLATVYMSSGVTLIEKDAFVLCGSLKTVRYSGTLEKWCNITFSSAASNPMVYASFLYINNQSMNSMTTLEIPESLTIIKSSTFINWRWMNTVILPDTVTAIGSNAFSNCTHLMNINIPNSVVSIGAYAFSNCIDLKIFPIPDGVESIGDSVFDSCKSLETVSIPNSVESFGNYVFSGCGQLKYNTDANLKYLGNETNPYLVLVKPNRDGSTYEIKQNTRFIYSGAFSGCDQLKEISLPDDIKSIGHSAFSKCSVLQSIVIPSSVETIGASVFNGCSSIVDITVPFFGQTRDSVINCHLGYLFGSSQFDGSTLVKNEFTTSTNKTYYIPDSLKNVTLTDGNIKPSAFCNCSNLTGITLPDNATYIGSNAFYNCSGLTEIILPDGITTIGKNAFDKCSSLTEITIPDSVETINENALARCISLREVTIPFIGYSRQSLNTFGWLFGDYSNANTTSTTQYNSIYGTGYHVYSIPTSLEKVTVTDCETISFGAFLNCNNLKSITISDKTNTISDFSFAGCTGLTELSIPFTGDKRHQPTDTYQYPFGYIFGTKGYDNSTSTVQYYYGESNSSEDFTTYYIPSSLKKVTITDCEYIPYGAFTYCLNLSQIILNGNTETIGDRAFEGCYSADTILLPKTVSYIGNQAFESCADSGTIYFLNKDCVITDAADTICADAAIAGYAGSTAEEYANKYSRTFIEIYDTCSVCGMPVTGLESQIDATCTTNGSRNLKCLFCYHKQTQELESTGHHYIEVMGYEPTSSHTGLTDGIYCDRCGEWLIEQTEIPMLDEPIQEMILGDANGDGDISILDVTIIQRFLANQDIFITIDIEVFGDIDGNGLDIIDATLIQRYLANFDVPYDIGNVK